MRKPVTFGHIWKTDSGLTVLLVFLVVTIFIAYPITALPFGKVLVLISFSFILISGATFVLDKHLLRFFVLGSVLLNLVLHWVTYIGDVAGLASWTLFCDFICCGVLAVIVLVQVFRAGPITIHRITGAIAVYLLIGLMWAFVYQLIELQFPAAFKLPASMGTYTADTLQSNLLYFSFVTLTTLGYGDILAVHPSARMLVMLEALTGQLFPAILLARLVSLEIMHKKDRSKQQQQ
ncbi:MAG: potassium channel family protein [Proteobacteria bacterium]|nr:potassium channel family protein [Pseudomonadota bacterium]